jgi:hypothetical protein
VKSQIIETETSVNDTFSKIQQSVDLSDYKIKSIEVNKSLVAEGGRSFSWLILAVLVVLVFPGIVYYFTRQRSSVTVTILEGSDKNCKVSINSIGRSGNYVMNDIANKISKGTLSHHIDDERVD